MSVSAVNIYGQGLTQLVCAKLLARQECHSNIIVNSATDNVGDFIEKKNERLQSQDSGPMLVLNDVCLSLLLEMFPQADWSNLGHRLTFREVLWGKDATLRVIKQPSIVLSSRQLNELIELECKKETFIHFVDKVNSKATWNVNPPNNIIQTMHAGQRLMWLADVSLRTDVNSDRCYMETCADAWLFLIPVSETQASLQVMVADPLCTLDFVLGQSWLVASLVKDTLNLKQHLASAKITTPLMSNHICLLGHRAISLDPISGEGTPFALRSALLASTIMAQSGGDTNDLMLHYNCRLIKTMIAHLEWCVRYYMESFSHNAYWKKEIVDMKSLAEKLLELQSFYSPVKDYRLVKSLKFEQKPHLV